MFYEKQIWKQRPITWLNELEEEFGIILSLNFVYRPLFKTKSLNRFREKKISLVVRKIVRGTADMLGTTANLVWSGQRVSEKLRM